MTPSSRSPWHDAGELSDAERAEVLDLLARTASRRGREALDESRQRIVRLARPALHWWRRDAAGRLCDYAQVAPGSPPVVEAVGGRVDAELLAILLERHGVVDWWERTGRFPGGTTRRTLELRASHDALPALAPRWPPGTALRTFDPAHDVAAWLAHNHAAFAAHPEQGSWRADELRERLAEPWFDPRGFLVLARGRQVVASCWTKVHDGPRAPFGEIYVVAVDPTLRARGLGRALVVAGVASLRARGLATVTLFVDATNDVARALYDDLGFAVVRRERLVRFDATRRPGGPPGT